MLRRPLRSRLGWLAFVATLAVLSGSGEVQAGPSSRSCAKMGRSCCCVEKASAVRCSMGGTLGADRPDGSSLNALPCACSTDEPAGPASRTEATVPHPVGPMDLAGADPADPGPGPARPLPIGPPPGRPGRVPLYLRHARLLI